jgi:uncharacterized membrane protein YeaQ/YmgE (transglycosylase-associated protein family)
MPGAGLGLAIVGSVAEANGGTLHVQTGPGGSTFISGLCRPHREVPANAQQARTTRTSAGRTVDDMVVLALIALVIVLVLAFSLIGIALWALISVGIVGIVIGGLARLILPGQQNIGLLGTVLLGWIGSVIGGFVGYRILDTGRLLTILLEIGIAAGLIFLYSQSQRNRLPGQTRSASRL